ncbi:hypothetical protein ACX8XN_08235 [Calditrichota bacterium GD2]
MFATLLGTNTDHTEYRSVFDQLRSVAIERGFAPPGEDVRVQADGPLEGWKLEQKGPADLKADFLLAVTAPRVPGISPIFPAFKNISGPLFAVVVLDAAFVVSREDRRDVSETKDIASVVASFESFLDGLRRPAP